MHDKESNEGVDNNSDLSNLYEDKLEETQNGGRKRSKIENSSMIKGN